MQKFIFLSALALPALAFADGGLFVPMQAGVPAENDAIAMSKADILFVGQVDGRDVSQWQVTEKYQLTNTTDSVQQLTVAVPMENLCFCEDCKCDPSKSEKCLKTQAEQFTVTVQGQKQALLKLDMPRPVYEEGEEGGDCSDAMGFYYGWDLSFQPGQTLEVQETYVSKAYALDYLLLELPLSGAQLWKDKKIGQLQIEVRPQIETIPYSEELNIFPYPPDGLDVPMLYDDYNFDVYKAEVYPTDMVSEGKDANRVYKWSHKDFTPNHGLHLSLYSPNRYGLHLQRFYACQFRHDPNLLDDSTLRYLRNLPYARWGYTFQLQDMKQTFAQEWWYKIDKGFEPNKRITQEEFQMIKTIKAIEAERKAKLSNEQPQNTPAASKP